jgi:pimeloyl-ACP methyl ester carboxylesterase
MERASTAAVFFLACAIFPAAAGARSSTVIDDPAYAQAQRLVDIDHGRRLNLYCIGTGAPTVVFDAGLANWSQIWGLVQPVVARTTRACSYDRAGLGFSDAASRPGTSANIADDLHRLLHAAQIEPPYVLVGHSYGGMNVRLYADLYRDEVAGLVLDDPSHEEHSQRSIAADPDAGLAARFAAERAEADRTGLACLAAARAGFVPGTAIDAECISSGRNLRYSLAINAVYQRLQHEPSFLQARLWEDQAYDLDSPAQLMAARRSYGDLPLVVLTRALSDSASGLPDDAHGDLAVALHEDLAGLSTRGVHRVVPDSSHDIHLDQPQAVIDAILDVLAQVRGAR